MHGDGGGISGEAQAGVSGPPTVVHIGLSLCCLKSQDWVKGKHAQVYFGCTGEDCVWGFEAATLSLSLGRWGSEWVGVESEAWEERNRQACSWRIWGELKPGTLVWCQAPARGDLLKGQNASWMFWVTKAGSLGRVTLGSQ